MNKEIDDFYLTKDEPLRSCLFALREIILNQSKEISTAWKYKMPFFCYKGKMFCYLWVHKKTHQPYIGIVEGRRINHPALILEKRAKMKIMLFDPDKDLPLKTVEAILKEAMSLYD